MTTSKVIDNIMLFIECSLLGYAICITIIGPFSIIHLFLILFVLVPVCLNLNRRRINLQSKSEEKNDDQGRPNE